MKDTSDIGSASTILRDIFLAVQTDWTTGAVYPPPEIFKETVCALSGELANEMCPNRIEEYFFTGTQLNSCSWHDTLNGRVIVRYPELYRKWAIKNNPNDHLDFKQEQKKRISFPQQGDFFYISNAIAKNDQQITFEVMGFHEGDMIDYYLNGSLYQSKPFPQFPAWQLRKGNYRLAIRVNNQTVDTLDFIVQ
jgi:hypothetical protein